MTNPTTQITVAKWGNANGAFGWPEPGDILHVRNDAFKGYGIYRQNGRTSVNFDGIVGFMPIEEPPEVIMAAMVQAEEARRG